MPKPYTCAKCGRFVGHDVPLDIYELENGLYEWGRPPLCARCFREQEAKDIIKTDMSRAKTFRKLALEGRLP